MTMELTNKLPDKEGYYYWTNFGEHTPVILEVTRDYDTRKLWAQDEEFCFEIKKVNRKKVIAECKELGLEPIDGHYHGEELWCYIPNPFVGKKQVKPSCY